MTIEQMARDLLERLGIEDAQSYTTGDLVELANLIADNQRLRAALLTYGQHKMNCACVSHRRSDDGALAIASSHFPTRISPSPQFSPGCPGFNLASVDNNNTAAIQIIRRKQLAELLDVSPVTVWRMRDQLPPQVQISKGVRGWRAADIREWQERRLVR